MIQILADIALPVPIDHAFTYLVPPDLESLAILGSRVIVPFGRKHITGVIVGRPPSTSVKGLKPIQDVLDSDPSYSQDMLRLTKWISEYYFTPWGEVLRAAIPQGLTRESKRIVRLATEDAAAAIQSLNRTASKQRAILERLQEAKGLTVSQLAKKTRTRSIHAVLNELQQHGWIHIEEELPRLKVRPKLERLIHLSESGKEAIRRLEKEGDNTSLRLSAKQSAFLKQLADAPAATKERVNVLLLLKKVGLSLSSLKSIEKKGLVELSTREVVREGSFDSWEPTHAITLNTDQQEALTSISRALEKGFFKTFLLHGVTGSGKTQVYIESIRRGLEQGKSAIVLVPEISLTPQTVRRFKSHFTSDVTVMHSQMSVGERYDAWRLAHQGKVKIVIGPRSAIFAPLKNIGLIVVDEEQEASYKQFDASPRYNARDVAIVRASNSNAVVILGSATPSVESYYNSLNGKYEVLELPRRVDEARMPEIDIVDMARERKRHFEELKEEIKASGKPFPKQLPALSISGLLKDQIAQRLEKKQGVILLQNRRGFSHVMECFECGYVEKCDNCDVTLTFHLAKKHLRCHYCGFVKKPPTVCAKCGGFEIRFHAYGTQQVQQEVQELFPAATILRMDRDTTSRKGAHDRLLRQFGEGEADILLGTQMVAKGLDFPRVTLVGVVSADTQMLLPDFRASERTFQLLTQVAGRAGRSKIAGEVVIQTLQPDHYSLKHVKTHDFAGFYKEELEYRRELDYPPFSRIVLLEIVGERENEVQHHAKKFAEFLSQHNSGNHFLILGPADAAIPKIKNLFRKHVLVKDLKEKDPAGSVLRQALLKAKGQYDLSALAKNRKIRLTIDVDPQGMM